MSKFNGAIIHPTARYQTQTASQARGVYSMEEQYLHRANGKWPIPFEGWPSNAGERVTVTITLDSTGADSTANYQTYGVDFGGAHATGSVGRLYLAIKNTATSPVAYYNDFCIGAVQLTSDDYSTMDHAWSFSHLADYTAWEYATVTGLDTTSPGYETYNEIIGATSQSWASCVNGVSNGRISRATATGSTYTGAADGLDADYSSDNAGNIIDGSSGATIAQTSGTSFMYTESSGSSVNIQNKWYWVRSPEVTLDQNDDKRLVIAYLAATHHTHANRMVDASDNQLLRWWWIPS